MVTVGAKKFAAYADEIRLLGVWNGLWDRPAGETLEEELRRPVKVPVGMGLATPIARLREILDYPKLVQARQDAAARATSNIAATMD